MDSFHCGKGISAVQVEINRDLVHGSQRMFVSHWPSTGTLTDSCPVRSDAKSSQRGKENSTQVVWDMLAPELKNLLLDTSSHRTDMTQQFQAAEKELPAQLVILSPFSAPGYQPENL